MNQKNRYDKQNRSKQFYSWVQTMDHGRLGIILSNGYVSYPFSPSSILVFLHKLRISPAASDTVKISVDKSYPFSARLCIRYVIFGAESPIFSNSL